MQAWHGLPATHKKVSHFIIALGRFRLQHLVSYVKKAVGRVSVVKYAACWFVKEVKTQKLVAVALLYRVKPRQLPLIVKYAEVDYYVQTCAYGIIADFV